MEFVFVFFLRHKSHGTMRKEIDKERIIASSLAWIESTVGLSFCCKIRQEVLGRTGAVNVMLPCSLTASSLANSMLASLD
jgi:hypothetical protein